MSIEEFKQQANEWMSSLGYEIHHYSTDWASITYTNYVEFGGPMIQCRYNQGDPKCSITQVDGFRFFMSMQSGDMQFKHPDMQKYIDYCFRVGALLNRANP